MINKDDIKNTDFSDVETGDSLTPISPGEILQDFIVDYEITAYRLAQDIGVPQTRIAAIINNGRAITADTALRLSMYFSNSAEFWMNLQTQYELRTGKINIDIDLKKIKPIAA